MKAILVMEMPSSCEKCRLHSFVGKDCDVVCQAKGTTQSYEDAYNGKPDWCPLKPMPDKKVLSGDVADIQKMGKELMDIGYNACIDEILGDKE